MQLIKIDYFSFSAALFYLFDYVNILHKKSQKALDLQKKRIILKKKMTFILSFCFFYVSLQA